MPSTPSPSSETIERLRARISELTRAAASSERLQRQVEAMTPVVEAAEMLRAALTSEPRQWPDDVQNPVTYAQAEVLRAYTAHQQREQEPAAPPHRGDTCHDPDCPQHGEQEPAAEPEPRLAVGQLWQCKDGEVLTVVSMSSAGARVRCGDGKERNYTRRSFSNWTLRGAEPEPRQCSTCALEVECPFMPDGADGDDCSGYQSPAEQPKQCGMCVGWERCKQVHPSFRSCLPPPPSCDNYQPRKEGGANAEAMPKQEEAHQVSRGLPAMARVGGAEEQDASAGEVPSVRSVGDMGAQEGCTCNQTIPGQLRCPVCDVDRPRASGGAGVEAAAMAVAELGQDEINRVKAERDAAIKRAETAERECDDMRRAYAVGIDKSQAQRDAALAEVERLRRGECAQDDSACFETHANPEKAGYAFYELDDSGKPKGWCWNCWMAYRLSCCEGSLRGTTHRAENVEEERDAAIARARAYREAAWRLRDAYRAPARERDAISSVANAYIAERNAAITEVKQLRGSLAHWKEVYGNTYERARKAERERDALKAEVVSVRAELADANWCAVHSGDAATKAEAERDAAVAENERLQHVLDCHNQPTLLDEAAATIERTEAERDGARQQLRFSRGGHLETITRAEKAEIELAELRAQQPVELPYRIEVEACDDENEHDTCPFYCCTASVKRCTHPKTPGRAVADPTLLPSWCTFRTTTTLVAGPTNIVDGQEPAGPIAKTSADAVVLSTGAYEAVRFECPHDAVPCCSQCAFDKVKALGKATVLNAAEIVPVLRMAARCRETVGVSKQEQTVKIAWRNLPDAWKGLV